MAMPMMVFREMTDADRGGGIFVNSATVTINNSTISENNAFHRGGGIFADNKSTATIIKSTLSGNTAIFGGGCGFYYDSYRHHHQQSPLVAILQLLMAVGWSLFSTV